MSITRPTHVGVLALLLASANALAYGPPVDGACCLNDGNSTCVELTQIVCEASGGTWIGPAVMCPPSPVTISDIDANVPIPDDDPVGISRTIMMPFEGVVTNLTVDLKIDHTFVGDLCVTLEHEGRLVPLIRRSGGNGACHQGAPFGCSSANYDISLDDASQGESIEHLCGRGQGTMTPPGSYTPIYSLDDNFSGTMAAGPWTLNVSDNASGNVGMLRSWAVNCAVSCPCCCGLSPGPLPQLGCMPETPKACCLPTGLCTSSGTEMDCMMAGGNVINEGGFPLCLQCHSCSLSDGSCTFDGPEACAMAGGESLVSYTESANYGACCFGCPGPACCRRLEEDECTSEGGTFLGLATDCLACVPPSCCVGDINGNGEIEFQDLLAILATWSPGAGSCVGCGPADVDEDDDVDFQDLLIVLAGWGPCP